MSVLYKKNGPEQSKMKTELVDVDVDGMLRVLMTEVSGLVISVYGVDRD